MNTRSYNQLCGLAYALDVVGERWTLLIIRELYAGPRRFKDLLDGLPGISTNLLTDRLKGLEQQGMLIRRTLPAPAASTVYDLTPLARALEPALLELGKWGAQFVPPLDEEIEPLHLGSYALTHKTFFRSAAAQGIDETYEVRVDGEVLQVRVRDGDAHVQQGDALAADAVFTTRMRVYMGLLAGKIAPEEAIAAGLVRVDGDPDALRRFLSVCGLPAAQESCGATVDPASLPEREAQKE
jgi:DNA-binding HxlR family transcriptional regulator